MISLRPSVRTNVNGNEYVSHLFEGGAGACVCGADRPCDSASSLIEILSEQYLGRRLRDAHNPVKVFPSAAAGGGGHPALDEAHCAYRIHLEGIFRAPSKTVETRSLTSGVSLQTSQKPASCSSLSQIHQRNKRRAKKEIRLAEVCGGEGATVLFFSSSVFAGHLSMSDELGLLLRSSFVRFQLPDCCDQIESLESGAPK